MTRAIVFDVDGVVIRSKNEQGQFLWSLDIELDLGMPLECRREIFAQEWKRVACGELETIEHLQNVFKKYPQLSITPEEFVEYWLSHDANVDLKVIEYVQGLRMPKYLGTNQDRLRIEYLKELVGVHFDGIFASCEMRCMKPEEIFFRNIERQLNLKPHELMLIDDDVKNVERAQSCGWEACLYAGDVVSILNVC